MSFSNIHFILYKPQLPENIGACARALKNFNFRNLSIVSPKISFPNKKALATSVGAKNIIQSCKIYDNFEKLEKKGVTILRSPRDGKMAFIHSPDQISIELLQQGDPLPN